MMNLTELASNIFGFSFLNQTDSTHNENITNAEIQKLIHQIEESIANTFKKDDNVNNVHDERVGRLGPKLVRLDPNNHFGIFIVTPDRLGVISQSNFSTLRANAGVYKGKWLYEVQLGSKGVMQVGWSTPDCKFSLESGVGDIVNSYAYDGNRIRKWNVSTHKYGEAWLSGDIIGCAIDMEKEIINFYRNGKYLGVAFERISKGPGIVYFPTVSLTFSENLTANFGTTPMRYPVEGYQVLQEAPIKELEKSKILFGWLEKLIVQYKNLNGQNESIKEVHMMSDKAFLTCIARCILKEIGPLVEVPYIAQDIFITFIQKLSKTDLPMMNICLDLMWSFVEVHEIKSCLEAAISYLSSEFRQVSTIVEYSQQRDALTLLNNLCQHTRTRQYLLQFILFDKVKFANFIHVKPLDDSCLNNIVNTVWWETEPVDPLVEIHKDDYLEACNNIKFWITELEALQVEFLITLLNNNDGNKSTPTSRTIFLKKFRRFVQDNLITTRPISINQTPLPISLCCFHRILVAFRLLWDGEVGTSPIFIPCRSFCDSTISYTGIDRLGGVLSHLTKTYANDLQQILGEDFENATEPEASHRALDLFGGTATVTLDSPVISVFARTINMNSLSVGGTNIMERISYFPYHSREDRTPLRLGPVDSATQLYELLDGIILFYFIAAKKQIAKAAGIRDAMTEYVTAMSEIRNRLISIKESKDEDSQLVQNELLKTIEIFNKKLTEQGRHMAWVRAVIYSEEKQERIAWLSKIVILTLSKASESGNLFGFVPDFYLEVLADMVTALKNHMNPTVPLENLSDFKQILKDVAQLLCDHYLDPRIVNANSKDTLILTLASFSSNYLTLEALENVTKESRVKMVSNLLKSYENRAWAQSNWILVRFYHGNGFAFRYEKSPHIARKIGPKILNHEAQSQNIKPCPSLIYQQHVREVLLSNNQATTLFFNSLLNQLNWAFSEFIGMVQEIHNASSRPQRVYIESRQLKVCATCFDLAVASLRVLEMIASIALEVFNDSSLPSSENLLARLCQLVCQILNRTSMPNSSFQHTVLLDLPDLQIVDHFPIITAVMGIVVALLKDEVLLPETETIPKITKALISEPSFQIASLHFALGEASENKMQNVKQFSLLNYKDHVSETEIECVRKVIKHLDYYRTRLPLAETPCNEEDLCTICYAFPISAKFKPCNHLSCHSCIDRHLLNSRNCFFCKATIKQVVSIDGKILHDFSNSESDSLERN